MHANAEQVCAWLQKKHIGVGKATVYRNLSKMAETGEILCVGSFLNNVHYDHNTHEHHHFMCSVCKKVFDIDGTVDGVLKTVSGVDGFVVQNVNFFGTCKECTAKTVK